MTESQPMESWPMERMCVPPPTAGGAGMAVKMTSGTLEVMDYRWQSPLQPGTPTSPHLEDFPWSVKKEKKNMLSRSLGFVPSITLV